MTKYQLTISRREMDTDSSCWPAVRGGDIFQGHSMRYPNWCTIWRQQ